MEINIGSNQSEGGKFPKHWQHIDIGEIGEIIGGGTPPTKEASFYGGNIPWISPRDLSGYSNMYISKGSKNITELGLKNSSARLMPKGTVLFSSRAPIGYVAIAKNEISTNQGFKSIICNEKIIHNIFLYYWLKKNKDLIESHSSGSTFKEISGSQLKEIRIPLPPLPEQKAISKILSDLDSKIEILQKQNEALENMGQLLFKRWFVDFEFPNKKGKEYKSNGGKMVDSELGEIPEGWRVGKLGDLSKLQNGYAFKGKDFLDEGEGVIKIKNISKNIVDINTTQYVSPTICSNIDDRFKVSGGDLLIAMTGAEVAKVGIIPKNDLKLWLNQRVGNIKEIKIGGKIYSYIFLSNKKTMDSLKGNANGAAQPNISSTDVENLKIVVPTDNMLKSFFNIFNPQYKIMLENLFQIQSLTKLRDTLLPQLMSGKVRVKI